MELKEKVEKINTFTIIWFFLGFLMFFFGILNHDWFKFLGGIFMLFDHIQIIHWGGKRYE